MRNYDENYTSFGQFKECNAFTPEYVLTASENLDEFSQPYMLLECNRGSDDY